MMQDRPSLGDTNLDALNTAVDSGPVTDGSHKADHDKKYSLGHSLPALDVDDLPGPEQVHRARRIGWEELILLILGPGVIALGVSIGSGEWLYAPLSVSQLGIRGLAWIMLIAVILQVFYNVELARYTLATGEIPLTGFGRAWPGRWLWVTLAMVALLAAFIFGDWSVEAGASLFTLINGRAHLPEELLWVRLLSIALMVTTVIILSFGRKLERTMEAIQGIILPYVLVGLVFVCITVVPFSYWIETIGGFLIPTAPPEGIEANLLGRLVGFVALASGLNFMFIVYYRDKGFGMGSRMGYLAGLFARRKPEVRFFGITFQENEQNTHRWKQWFRYLVIDQWAIYFVGVMLGIMLPVMLVSYLAFTNPANPPDSNNILVYAALRLGEQFGALISGWVLLTGFVIMYTTQMVILDLLARNFTEGLFTLSQGLRRLCKNDPRRVYYPALLLLVGVISAAIFIDLPETITLYSANMANFAALIFPLLLIYLNLKLPKPARITWWSILVLVANTIFFGFFFINFIVFQFTGSALIGF